MGEFIRGTAWPMEFQPLFGAFHLTYVAIGLAAAVIAAILLRNISERRYRLLLGVIGCGLIVSEVYKQLFWHYAIRPAEYNFINLPFHLCSIPLYLCVVLAVIPESRFRRVGLTFLATYCFVGGLISVAVDGGLLRNYVMMTLHSMNWHIILVFLGLHLALSGRMGRGARDFRNAVILYMALAGVAFLINCALWNVSNGTCDMFFVGPAPMNVVVFRDIAGVIGRPLVTLFYLAMITLAAWISWLALRGLNARGTDKK